MLRGIRGAITVGRNNEEEIKKATLELVEAVLKENNIKEQDIAFVNFTATCDINCAYPAKFARMHQNFKNVPLTCTQEMQVEDSLKMCIRTLFCVNTIKSQDEMKHQYLKGASVLRPDIM
jgi:chorismate mutase